MYKFELHDTVKVIENGKTGTIEQGFPAGTMDICENVFVVKFDEHHSGMYKTSELEKVI